MEECIHGLETGLCDVCYPKVRPDTVRAVRQTAGQQQAARQHRATSSSARSTLPARGGVATGLPRASHATTSKRSIVASQQRIYHVTHVRNLEAILESGRLRADATPVVDLSTPLTRELRATVELPTATRTASSSVAPAASNPVLREALSTVPSAASSAGPSATLSAGPPVGPGGASSTASSVASRVAFYLSPDATLWNDVRSGAADEVRWSTAARRAAASDFVVLVSTIGALGADVVVTDGDAAGTYTRFFTGDAAQRAVERAHDSETVRVGAEVLGGSVVDFESIQLIGVANDPMRDRVRELVAIADAATKVSVYPPWFQPG